MGARQKNSRLLQQPKLQRQPGSCPSPAQGSTAVGCVRARRRVGSVAEEEMNKTPNAERPTSNVERLEPSTAGVRPSALDIKRLLWRILDLIVAGIFIFAGFTKIFDLDHLIADLQ